MKATDIERAAEGIRYMVRCVEGVSNGERTIANLFGLRRSYDVLHWLNLGPFSFRQVGGVGRVVMSHQDSINLVLEQVHNLLGPHQVHYDIFDPTSTDDDIEPPSGHVIKEIWYFSGGVEIRRTMTTKSGRFNNELIEDQLVLVAAKKRRAG